MTDRPDALLWTDLETTGLEPDARILEVAAIGGIPVPRDLEDALLASAAAHDRMEGPDPLDTPTDPEESP